MAWTVLQIQTRLKEMGYYAGKVTGELNEETRAAIRKFQEITTLDPTGNWDEKTEQAIIKRSTSYSSSSEPGGSWLEDVTDDSNTGDEPELPDFLR